jgi:hypothetical protein
VYVVKVAPDHVTITATTSAELPEGKTYTEGIVMTADYHLARDGTTLVGLITGVDAVIEGTLPSEIDAPSTGDELSRIQKVFVDKPIAFNVRIYGDMLVIGNVRLPDVEGRGVCYPLTVLGGRYTQLGDKPLPKPKAAKMLVPRDMLPTPLATGPNSNYIPSPGILPTSGTLPALPLNVPNTLPALPQPPVSIPTPGIVPVGLNSTPLNETAIAPLPREVPKLRKKGKKKPNLNPERIHGGKI